MRYQSTEDVAFRDKVRGWLAEAGEVSALIRFSGAAGSKSFEFFRNLPDFCDRLVQLPPRTCVTTFGKPQLPIRGRVNEEFIQRAALRIPEGTEYLIVGLELVTTGSASWFQFTAGENIDQMKADLADRFGEIVAVGCYPPWLQDGGDVISAVVPEPDGSVVVGVY